MSAAAAGPAAPGVDAVRLLPLPEILRWAIEQGDDGLNVAALVEAVAHDPALAVRALALARETDPTGAAPSDLRASARALGGATLHALVLRASIDWLRGVASGPGQAGLAAWWTHSVESAYLAAALAEALGYARPEQAYLAGLLHDAGMAAHMAQSPAAYRTLLSSSVSEAHLLARESESLGAGHPELGEAIGVQIGLAEPVCDALLLQHANEDELRGTHALVRIVWTAEADRKSVV